MKDYTFLIDAALAAKENAYAPYSNFHVGAALLSNNGTVFTGSNIENASYSATNCAERTAFFTAIAQGIREFEAIAIVSDSKDFIAPCGVCRQVMIEFCSPDFIVLMCKADGTCKKLTLADLMPCAFDQASLQ